MVVLRGKASDISFGGMTYINLDGTVYIDCKNQVVYSIDGTTKVNRLSNFSGEFIEISPEPDVNVFTVSGSITNLTIEFDYKNTFLIRRCGIMYPELYDSNGKKIAILDNIIEDTASIPRRVINGEGFTFTFDAYEQGIKK